MGRIARLSIAAAAALAVPALAHAEERTLTFTTAPISVPAYGVAQQPMLAESPSVDGYVVGMEAEVVDANGKVQGRDKVMLHHIVFAKIGVARLHLRQPGRRALLRRGRGTARAHPAPRLRLSEQGNRPLGSPVHADEPQAAAPERLIRYTVRYVTGEALTPVKPIWLDIRNCSGPDPVFDIPGGGKRFSTFTKTADFTMPESGRLVSGGGHLHGGALRLELRNASCNTTPFESRPPGVGRSPAAPARAGPDEDVLFPLDDRNPGCERPDAPPRRGLRQRGAAHAGDGDHAAVPRSGRGRGLRGDAGSRHRSRQAVGTAAVLDALAARAAGPVSKAKSTFVGDFRYGVERILLKRGTTFTWRFMGAFQHDVTVIGGPEGFSAPWMQTRHLHAPLHESGHVPPLLLTAPVEDGAADHRPLTLMWRKQKPDPRQGIRFAPKTPEAARSATAQGTITAAPTLHCRPPAGRARSGRRRRGRGR